MVDLVKLSVCLKSNSTMHLTMWLLHWNGDAIGLHGASTPIGRVMLVLWGVTKITWQIGYWKKRWIGRSAHRSLHCLRVYTVNRL